MRKKATLFVYLIAVLLVLVSAEVTEAFSGSGSGTEQNPYIITNIYQLQEMNNDLDAWYKLGDDIDASDTRNWNDGEGFTPIGSFQSQAFLGRFDGGGHTISLLYINDRPSSSRNGLFGWLGTGASVSNVGLADVNVTGRLGVGGLAVFNQATISNSYCTGTVSGGANGTGGLVGSNSGTITESYFSGNVSDGYYVGGLVGYLHVSGIIDRCYSEGSAINGSAGGLVGLQETGTHIEDSYSTASVSGIGYAAGGFLGICRGNVNNCYSTGNVSGADHRGGFVGVAQDGVSCTNCYWDIETSEQTTSARGTPKTTAEMKQQATFINWDFDTVWDIVEGSTYPYLRENNRVIFIDSVPYIHQCFDTLESFDDPSKTGFYGWHACGATSAVMALAALDRIVPWPCKCIGSTKDGDFRPTVGTHTSAYGNYVFKQYAYAGEIWGDEPDEVTNDAHQPPDAPIPARGAYGYIHHNPDPNTHAGHGNLIQEFLYKHGIHGDGKAKWPGAPDYINNAPNYISDPDPGIDYVKGELAQGRLLIASTMLPGAGHFVLIIGYSDPNFIVNDPFGEYDYSNNYDWPYSAWGNWGNYPGKSVEYTWDDMCNSSNCLNSTISIVYAEDLNNTTPPEPSSLKVKYPNGDEIPLGGWTLWPSVTFEGFVKDVDSPQEERDSVRLEVELIRFGGGKWNYMTDFTPDWSLQDVNGTTYEFLPFGRYRWQARTVDIRGANSPWVNAGNNGSQADFMVVRVFKLVNLINDILGGDGSENSQRPKAMGESAGQSPANMVLTDPTGAIVSMDAIEIPGAIYEEVDIDGDGDLDDLIAVPEDKIGNYVIKVIPESGTSADDTFSFQVEENGESIVLAENTKFSDAPAEGYIFESKLCESDFDTDGDVDYVDLAKMSQCWLAQDCNYPDWCDGTDLNYNGQIDFIDFSLFAKNWLWEKIPADFDIDGDVDFQDFAIFALAWLTEEGQTGYDSNCDIAIPYDKAINEKDLQVFTENWLLGH